MFVACLMVNVLMIAIESIIVGLYIHFQIRLSLFRADIVQSMRESVAMSLKTVSMLPPTVQETMCTTKWSLSYLTVLMGFRRREAHCKGLRDLCSGIYQLICGYIVHPSLPLGVVLCSVHCFLLGL